MFNFENALTNVSAFIYGLSADYKSKIANGHRIGLALSLIIVGEVKLKQCFCKNVRFK